VRPPSPSYTPTRRPITYTPTYDPSYTSTPTRTPTITRTPTPIRSILVYKVLGYPAISAARDGSPGGLGRFGVKVSGYGDQWIQLIITRTDGIQGWAIFNDTWSDTMWVPGECDREFLVRGQQTSDLPRNLEVQGLFPAADGGGVASREPFTVFWMGENNRWIPQGRFFGPIPANVQGAGKPIFQYLQDNRADGRNELGVADDPKGAMRGNALLFFRVHPSGMDPGDFRQGGPFLGFGPTEGFDEMRSRVSRFYVDGCLFPSPSGNKQSETESSAAVLKDLKADNPDANGDLYIYDYDAPSLPKVFPKARRGDGLDHYTRIRENFSEWATYTDDEGNKLRASEDYSWYFRGSWHLKPNGQVVAEGVPDKDNEVLDGSTQLTYNLRPDDNPDPSITRFRPTSWNSLAGRFQFIINGDFPQGTSDCDWQIELTAPGDPKGDPEQPEVGQITITPVSPVTRSPDGSTLTTVLDLRPNGIPFAAKQYTVRVLQGPRSAEASPFRIIESTFDHWQFDHMSQNGDRISIFVGAVDVQGNLVTRPNDPPPRMVRTGGVLTSLFSVYGNDGIYYGEAYRANPGEQGPITIEVSGSGAPTLTLNLNLGP